MPVLRCVDGFNFFFYSDAGNHHDFAKIYVGKDGCEAEFKISDYRDPEVYLRRSHGFSTTELDRILDVVHQHRLSLRKSWPEAFC